MDKKNEEGVSMQKIESFARKYLVETFVILAIIIAVISSAGAWFTTGNLSLFFAGIGAIAAIAFPEKIMKVEEKYFAFVDKQEKTGQIAIGIVRVVAALFVPFIVFGQLGLLTGIAFHHFSHNRVTKEKPPQE